MAAPTPRGLYRLARLHGIQTAYYDITRERRVATPEALLGTLRALRAPVETTADVSDAIRARHLAVWRRGLEPVNVVWLGRAASVLLRRSARAPAGSAACALVLESGGRIGWSAALDRLPVAETAAVAGEDVVALRLDLPPDLPAGYHRLEVEAGADRFQSMLMVAPRRCYGARPRSWGVFLPLYALRTNRSWGAGDLTDLAALAEWTASLGGRSAGTLPLLSSFLDTPFEPSPYSPVSRLFWNELYVDPTRAPGFASTEAAAAVLRSPDWRAARRELGEAQLVDYRRQAALKRRVLEPLAAAAFDGDGARDHRLRAFLDERPRVRDYAAFRAACERHRSGWPAWPQRPRDGDLRPGDYDDHVMRYHLYVQWLAETQIAELARAPSGEPDVAESVAPRTRTRTSSARAQPRAELYLDLPLGVNPAGYDTWRERALFAEGAAAGAPPDTFFTHGQNWGFPPLHPEALREDGYRYFIETVRHHLRHAGLLRIDHVMSLHRMFWVPHGVDARDGCYVCYRSPELYAVLSLESHRARAGIVGEDLGTVPPEVRTAMGRHGVGRMFVVQYEITPDRDPPLRNPRHASVASLNTHDMPTFAAFWEGLDIEDRQQLGLLDEAGAEEERRRRSELRTALVRFLARRGLLHAPADDAAPADERVSTSDVLHATLRHLAAGTAAHVLVNLEDLWLETRPQNTPGTTDERPNWRRKALFGLEAARRLPEVVDVLREIDGLRKEGAPE